MKNSFKIRCAVGSNVDAESVVAMAVYAEDRLAWLTQAVESIVTQEYQSFIFVIVIDGPIPPEMLGYLDTVASSSSNIMLCEGTHNVGLSQCMNYVIDYTLDNFKAVRYFFRMDSDDISEHNRLNAQVTYFQSNPDVSVVGASLAEINEAGVIVGKRRLPLAHEQIIRVLPRRCALNHPTAALRMSVFESGSRYRPNLTNTQDYFLWIELAALGYKFANLAETLLRFRRVNDFYKRRGFDKSVNEFKARFLAMKYLKGVSVYNVCYAFAVILLRLMPAKLIKLAYKVDRYFLSKGGPR